MTLQGEVTKVRNMVQHANTEKHTGDILTVLKENFDNMNAIEVCYEPIVDLEDEHAVRIVILHDGPQDIEHWRAVRRVLGSLGSRIAREMGYSYGWVAAFPFDHYQAVSTNEN